MITYIDTSALIKVLIDEPGSAQVGEIWEATEALVSVSLIEVEARAALAAAARGDRITAAQHRRAKTMLRELVGVLDLAEISDELVRSAGDLAEHEALRGYDAVHLAAALFVRVDVLASADVDLCSAAARRGLHVANPTETPRI